MASVRLKGSVWHAKGRLPSGRYFDRSTGLPRGEREAAIALAEEWERGSSALGRSVAGASPREPPPPPGNLPRSAGEPPPAPPDAPPQLDPDVAAKLAALAGAGAAKETALAKVPEKKRLDDEERETLCTLAAPALVRATIWAAEMGVQVAGRLPGPPVPLKNQQKLAAAWTDQLRAWWPDDWEVTPGWRVAIFSAIVVAGVGIRSRPKPKTEETKPGPSTETEPGPAPPAEAVTDVAA